MKRLHKKKIIHKNLTDDNILLDDNLEPILGSFSYSRFVTDEQIHDYIISTPVFTAPEIFSDPDEGYSFPVDVYSYGFMLYKMFEGSIILNKQPSRSVTNYLMRVLRGHRSLLVTKSL